MYIPKVRRNRGVTIIEVLFSIGIVMMGLLGVASLIMLAGAQMQDGIQQDGITNYGLSASHEFEIRGYTDHRNLLTATGQRFVWEHPNGNLMYRGFDREWGIAGQDDDGNNVIDDWSEFRASGSDDLRNPSFCFDPYGVMNGSEYYFPNASANRLNENRMTRVTGWDLVHLPATREVMVSGDALAIKQPESKTELPRQLWITDGVSGPKLKRIGFGNFATLGPTEFSWMGTACPHRTGGNDTNNSDLDDRFRLSIVIFYNRIWDETGEKSLLVEPIYNVNPDNPTTPKWTKQVRLLSRDISDLDIRTNDWLMLSGTNEHRWYRITFIDETAIPYQGRNTTLSSDEWFEKKVTVIGTDRYPVGVFMPDNAVYMPRVRGVFEKVIRLHSSSGHE